MAEESPKAKRAKYSHCGGNFPVTEEMMKDFSRDGYIIVKCVLITRSIYDSVATPTYRNTKHQDEHARAKTYIQQVFISLNAYQR